MPDETIRLPVRSRLETELIVLLVLTVVTFAMSAIVDPDLPGHLAYGLAHLESGDLPLRDPYSYSVAPSDVWVNHEWLFELTAATIFRSFGSTGLVVLQAAVWGLAGLLVMILVRRSSAAFVPSALLYLLFAAAAFASITIRPQLFSFLCLAILLTQLELARAGRLWVLATVPVLFLAWVNLHGGFLAGLCMLAAYAGGLTLDAALKRSPAGDLEQSPQRPWRLAAAAVAATALAFVCTFVNPYRATLWEFLVDSLGRPRPQISEWRPIGLDAQGILFLLMVALSGWALFARDRKRVPLAHVFMLVGTAVVSIRHSRHAAFFAMAAAAFVPGALADLYQRFVPLPDEDLEPNQLRRFRLTYLVLLGPALLMNLNWPTRDTLTLRIRPTGNSRFPTGALRYLEEHDVSGNLVVHFDWAQLMIQRLYPKVRVFYDGRFRTVYGPEIEDAFFGFMHWEEQAGWRRALDDYPTDWVLLPTSYAVTQRMLTLADWRVAYRDSQATLFCRDSAGAPQAVVGVEPPPTLPFDTR
jgi:hypothetical protein